jgi:hypothetical protein
MQGSSGMGSTGLYWQFSTSICQEEEKTQEEHASLYQAEQPTGNSIKIHVEPFHVDASIPSEEEICGALQRMKHGKAPDGSGIRVEHLIKQMEEAKETSWSTASINGIH